MNGTVNWNAIRSHEQIYLDLCPPVRAPHRFCFMSVEKLDDTKSCIACAEEIRKDARLCRFCRTAQDDTSSPGASIPTIVAADGTTTRSSTEASPSPKETPPLEGN